MKTKHTATPYKLPLKANGSETTTAMWVEDANGKRVATIKSCDNDADRAEFIARACNAHDEQCAALKASEQCMADVIELYKRGCALSVMDEAIKSLENDALKLTRAALAKAGATP